MANARREEKKGGEERQEGEKKERREMGEKAGLGKSWCGKATENSPGSPSSSEQGQSADTVEESRR